MEESLQRLIEINKDIENLQEQAEYLSERELDGDELTQEDNALLERYVYLCQSRDKIKETIIKR